MCAALYGESSTTQALTAKTIETNCKSLTVCYKAGNKAVPCTIAQIDCPPCVTFDNSGCYEKLGDGTCSFGSLCSTYWDEGTSTSAGSGSVATSTANPSSSQATAGVPTTSKNTTGTNSTTSTSSHSSAAGADTAGTAGSAASDSKGSDMSVVFAIIGAAMGVIAVAVIFLTLVRRSRAAHEDEDDVATPPAVMGGKEPVSTTAAVTYASYDRNRGTNGGSAALGNAAEPSVVSYYSQQPKDLPIASPRVAGRAVPAAAATVATTTSVASYYAQQPQNLPAVSPRVAGRAVPASAPRAVPMPAPAARAMPVFANNAPLSNPHHHQQQYQQETVYHQAPVAQVQEAPRRVSSPRNRRESFEF